MSNANLTMGINGVDKTAAAFNSVKARAKATGASIRSIMGGAIAAAGSYLSFRAVKGGIEEMGKLSDLAARSATSVNDLTRAATAFNVIGVDASAESLARAFAMMRKNTGREGLEGFYQTIEAIGKLPSAAERSQAAMAVFGRAGLEFMPLIDAAEKGTDAIRGVADAMPGIPDAAAQAGDDANDAMTVASNGFRSIWYQALGAVVKWFQGFFPQGLRSAAAEGMARLEYELKLGFINFKKNLFEVRRFTIGWVESLISATGKAFGVWQGHGGGFLDLFKHYGDITRAGREGFLEDRDKFYAESRRLEAGNAAREEKWKEQLDSKLESIDNLKVNYDKATDLSRGSALAEEIGTTAAKAAHRVSNSLIMGGSNAERRLSILGPTYQNEQKKQTSILEKIAKNTEKTAENTEGGEDLQVLDT